MRSAGGERGSSSAIDARVPAPDQRCAAAADRRAGGGAHRAEGFVGTDHVLLAAVNRTSHGCPELYALTGELERLSITTMSIDALARTRRQSGETRIETNHALGPLTCRIRGRILHDPARVVTLRQTREYRAALQSLWSRESATDAVDVFAAMLVTECFAGSVKPRSAPPATGVPAAAIDATRGWPRARTPSATAATASRSHAATRRRSSSCALTARPGCTSRSWPARATPRSARSPRPRNGS